MNAVVRILILVIAFALVTLVLGWWTIPILGGVWGLVAARQTWPAMTAAAAAGLSWALLLVWAAMQGPVIDLAGKVSAMVTLPTWGLFAITLLFPAVLAGSSAMLVASLRPGRKR